MTNGELDEEVRIEIDHRNRDWERRQLPKLEVVVKGQLLNRFQALHTNFWPIQLASEKTLLELFLSDGTDYLNKAKLAEFIFSLLPLDDDALSNLDCSRALASAAIMTAYSLSAYTAKANHVALIEGWMVYIACLTTLVEKRNLNEKYWTDSVLISKNAIHQAFVDLCDELQSRTHLVEGQPLVDAPFYRGRVTWLVGLVSAYALWLRFSGIEAYKDTWFRSFVLFYRDKLMLWGEAAVPQFLATMWFLRVTPGKPEADKLLVQIIRAICDANNIEQVSELANPYHDLPEVVSQIYGIGPYESRERYKGRSYTLESLVQLFARRNWRQTMRALWPSITHVDYAEFQPESPWQFCLWQSEDSGSLRLSRPQMPQSWAALRKQAEQVSVAKIPKLFQDQPELLLLFIIVYPHRLSPDVAKFLDTAINALPKK
ncbi:hypothetical protein [Aggregatilinea lenta]|uniref:hypothetical protein n=1 Tax=Aggregatilinea lenta TaxID=913108 RepID=UPI0013C35368|nr:hypothetical protein [Aggregatilinea lenta]